MGKTMLPTAGDLAEEVRRSSAAQVADAYGVTHNGLTKRLRLGGYAHDGRPTSTPVRTAERNPLTHPTLQVDTTWMEQAACSSVGPEWFYPDEQPGPRDGKEALAKSICAACPVRIRCLEWALAWDEATAGGSWGIHGGLNGAERDQLRKGKRVAS